jgi:hypothetical protein
MGSVSGAFCSISFFPPKTRAQVAMQLGVNFTLATMCSPFVVAAVAHWTGFPVTLRLSLLVSTLIGICGQQAVATGIPFARSWFVSKARKVTGEDGPVCGFTDVLLIVDDDATFRRVARRAVQEFADANGLRVIASETIDKAEEHISTACFAILDWHIEPKKSSDIAIWVQQFSCPVIVMTSTPDSVKLEEDHRLFVIDKKSADFVADLRRRVEKMYEKK